MIAYVDRYSSVIGFALHEIPTGAFSLATGGYKSLPHAVYATARRDGDDWHVPGAAEALAAGDIDRSWETLVRYTATLSNALRKLQDAIPDSMIEIGEIHVTSHELRFRAKGSPRFVRMPRGMLSAEGWATAVRIRLEQTQESGAGGISVHDIDRICSAILTSEDRLEPAGGAA